jgi:hypothetical protein
VIIMNRFHMRRNLAASSIGASLAALLWSSAMFAQAPRQFASPEDAVKALIAAVRAGDVAALVDVLGAESKTLLESSDPLTARQNRRVFTIAVGERWHLEDAAPNRKTLVIGNEDWPFPVPLVSESSQWRFDAIAGAEEVIARRIGRNELAAIATVRAYVTAQRRYAEQAHDGNPACIGGPHPASSEVRSAIWWRRRPQRVAPSAAIAGSRHLSTAITSGS